MQSQPYRMNLLTLAAIVLILLAFIVAQAVAAARANGPVPQLRSNSSTMNTKGSDDVRAESSSRATVTVNGETTEVRGPGTVERRYVSEDGNTSVDISVDNQQRAESGSVTHRKGGDME